MWWKQPLHLTAMVRDRIAEHSRMGKEAVVALTRALYAPNLEAVHTGARPQVRFGALNSPHFVCRCLRWKLAHIPRPRRRTSPTYP